MITEIGMILLGVSGMIVGGKTLCSAAADIKIGSLEKQFVEDLNKDQKIGSCNCIDSLFDLIAWNYHKKQKLITLLDVRRIIIRRSEEFFATDPEKLTRIFNLVRSGFDESRKKTEKQTDEIIAFNKLAKEEEEYEISVMEKLKKLCISEKYLHASVLSEFPPEAKAYCEILKDRYDYSMSEIREVLTQYAYEFGVTEKRNCDIEVSF